MPNLHYLVKLAYDLQTSTASEQLDAAAMRSVFVFGAVVGHDFLSLLTKGVVVKMKHKSARILHSKMRAY